MGRDGPRIVSLLGASVGVSSLFGPLAGFATFALGFSRPARVHGGYGRRLALLGYRASGSRSSVRHRIEQAREEHAVEHAEGQRGSTPAY